MNEYDSEPFPGLPETLPPGERMILQTSPSWRSFAIHAFHVRKIAVYCGAIVVWRILADMGEGMAASAALVDGVWLLPLAAAGVLIPIGLAWAYARTTIYTITDRRLVMRIGVALPMTFNLPFNHIGAASLRLYRDGSGDIPVNLTGDDRLAYAHLWPHARPWKFANPQPMLRAVPDAEKLASTLSAVLSGRAPEPASATATTPAAAIRTLATAAA